MRFSGGVGSFLIFGSFIFEESFLQKGEVIWKVEGSVMHLFHLFTFSRLLQLGYYFNSVFPVKLLTGLLVDKIGNHFVGLSRATKCRIKPNAY